jgi:hypothetical protein
MNPVCLKKLSLAPSILAVPIPTSPSFDDDVFLGFALALSLRGSGTTKNLHLQNSRLWRRHNMLLRLVSWLVEIYGPFRNAFQT